ncbi:flippase [Halorubrum ezzemoulense]|uniref:flippase n=1 Tax=Halorubrum ezzemoulense TaxID=337243 RepID=UPI00232E22B3|nr:flippase [Halorubrum ezzemoulense]MDB9235522.1 flippase [Halorubrum ezzemoulense]
MGMLNSSYKYFIFNLTGSAVSLLGIAYFSRELGAKGIGVYFLFQAVVLVTDIFSNMGIRKGVEKRLSESGSFGDIVSSGIILKCLLWALTGVITWTFSSPVENYIGIQHWYYVFVGLVVYDARGFFTSILKGKLKIIHSAIVSLFRRSGFVFFSFIYFQFMSSHESLIIGFITSEFLSAALGLYFANISVESPSFEKIVSIFEFSKYSFVTSVGGQVYAWSDVLILGWLASQTAVGGYEVSWRVAGAVMILSNSISVVLFPHVSSWDDKKLNDKIENSITSSLVVSLFLVIPAFFGSIAVSEELLNLVFGSEFTFASIVLILLMGEKVFQAFHNVIGKALLAIDRPKAAAKATLVTVVSNIVLNILLIPQFGVEGAAVATLTSFTINTALHYQYLTQSVRVVLPVKEVEWIVISSISMLSIIFILKSVFTISNIHTLLILILTGAFCFTIIAGINEAIRSKYKIAFNTLQNL